MVRVRFLRCNGCDTAAWVGTVELRLGLGRRCLRCRSRLGPGRERRTPPPTRQPKRPPITTSPRPSGPVAVAPPGQVDMNNGIRVYGGRISGGKTAVKMEGPGVPALFDGTTIEDVDVAFDVDGQRQMVLRGIKHRARSGTPPAENDRDRG